MNLPPAVLASLFPLGGPISYERLTGPWPSDLVMLSGPGVEYIVKRWRGEERIQRARVETAVLAELASKDFSRAPRSVPIAGEWVHISDPAPIGWTAQNLVRGRHPEAVSSELADSIGHALANLHDQSAGRRPAGTKPSRLHELKALPKYARSLDMTDRDLVMTAYERVAPLLGRAINLPRCRIHGDVNFNNLIDTGSGITFIDFEFSRFDVRLFDLVALQAPLRTHEGMLVCAPRSFLTQLLDAYQRTLKHIPVLEYDEIAMIEGVSLMHFLLIVQDQLRVGSRYVGRVLPVLPVLLERSD